MLICDKKIWRTKALGNVMMARDISDAFGGDRVKYLRTANQTLRRNIINSKIAVNETTKHIEETSNVRVPKRLENLVSVFDHRDNHKESNSWIVSGFAFAT
jgi:predicted HicB family RNase H-like nuclease